MILALKMEMWGSQAAPPYGEVEEMLPHGCVHAQPGQTQGAGTSPSVQG